MLGTIGQQNSALSHAPLAPMKAVTISGPGGISIPGYLTLPLGAPPGQRLPAVVYPHGGPYARDSWGYDPLVQLMANRGYAVLQGELPRLHRLRRAMAAGGASGLGDRDAR